MDRYVRLHHVFINPADHLFAHIACYMGYLYHTMEITSNHCDTTAYTSQALAAASKTVETMKIVHNLHSYFLLVGEINSKGIDLMCFCKQAIAFPLYLKTMPAIFLWISLDLTHLLHFANHNSLLLLQFPSYLKLTAYVMATTLPPEK